MDGYLSLAYHRRNGSVQHSWGGMFCQHGDTTFCALQRKTKKRMKLSPAIFASVVLIGLVGFVAFPGEPEIKIGSEFFIAPSILLLVSIISILLKDKTEPGSSINSVTAPPPLRDTL